MAEILDSFPNEKQHWNTRYPWSEWLDGKPRRFKQGVDFLCKFQSFRTHAYIQAHKRGLKLRLQKEDGSSFVIQAVPRNESA